MRTSIFILVSISSLVFSARIFDYDSPKQSTTDMKDLLNLTTAGHTHTLNLNIIFMEQGMMELI